MDEAELLRRVREIATRFRAALERCGPGSAYPGLECFPQGSCADAVLLLGAYFIDCGIGEFDHIAGECGDLAGGGWYSHAWLERDGIIVDITADQFPDVSESVIVTRNHRWHQQFHGTTRGVADYRRYDYAPETGAQLEAVYGRVCRMLSGTMSA